MTTKPKKKAVLRYNEYYGTQELFDDLYGKSKKGYYFNNLIPLIKNEENIKLAYRKIKRNKGSMTAGVDRKTIRNIAESQTDKMVKYFQSRIDNYIPQKVRRVEIPKSNGKKRPLGIPTIDDRIVQQCIKQVLEPICEAKFYPHSYGFRPNRSTHHAIGRIHSLVNVRKMNFVVDIDIKGFFDNVNHAKLLKQMWTLGIRDKNLFCILKKMLKAEIAGIGIPEIGTPQGGILSPLLSNIVLNELDWWISNQFETIKTKTHYAHKGDKTDALRKRSKLKEVCIVRYADDFKIFCRDYPSAKKIFEAVKMWLKERLKLDISEEKSKITNLRKNYTEFLGIKIKAIPKKKTYVIKSHITDKAKTNCISKLKSAIKEIKHNYTSRTVNKYNSIVLGLQGYCKIATMVSIDFAEIAFKVKNYLYNQLRRNIKKRGKLTDTYLKFYGGHNCKVLYVYNTALFPISAVKSKVATQFKQEICNYTEVGRQLIHDKLKTVSSRILQYLMNNPVKNESVEYNDNRISLYVGQQGLCGIAKTPLQIGKMDTHHIIPKSKGGKDEYANLIILCEEAHILIHATDKETVTKYLVELKPNQTTLDKINKLREQVGNYLIC